MISYGGYIRLREEYLKSGQYASLEYLEEIFNRQKQQFNRLELVNEADVSMVVKCVEEERFFNVSLFEKPLYLSLTHTTQKVTKETTAKISRTLNAKQNEYEREERIIKELGIKEKEHAKKETSKADEIEEKIRKIIEAGEGFKATKPKGEFIIPSRTKKIGKNAFWGCSELTSIIIPNGVSTIGDYAFFNCRNLSSIAIPKNVTKVGKFAFSGCGNLTTAVFCGRIRKIDAWSFSNCRKLETVIVPKGLKEYFSILLKESHMPSKTQIIENKRNK